LTHYLWKDLSQQIHDFLSSISLADLVEKREIKKIAENQDRKKKLIAADVIDRVTLSVGTL
jgi:Rrf2 family iron-sulfur cluster assembly transcriptional regulator